MIRQLQKYARDAKEESHSRKEIVSKLSEIFEKYSEHCDVKLRLKRKTLSSLKNDGLKLCNREDRKTTYRISPPRKLGNDFVILYSGGCAMAWIGVDTSSKSYLKYEGNIEINSTTIEDQQNKGYNELLRAVVFIIAYVEEKPLRSLIANPVSAYTLIKMFHVACIFTVRPQIREFDAKKKRLKDLENCKICIIAPTFKNLRYATRIIGKKIRHLQCFED